MIQLIINSFISPSFYCAFSNIVPMDDDVQIKLILAITLVFLYTVAIVITNNEQFTEIVLTLVTNVLVGFFTYNLTKRTNKHKR